MIEIPYNDGDVKKLDKYTVDQEMADYVQVYVDQVNREPGELLVEEVFDMSEVYGVKNQFGTGDAVKLDYENLRLYVGDLKYGQGVMVFAENSDQMYSYAAGALYRYDLLADWETITVAIHQPRMHHYDEHTLTRAELDAWVATTKPQAQAAITLIGLAPDVIEAAKTGGETQCQWCPIKDSAPNGCIALTKWTHEQVFDGFTNLNEENVVTKPESISDELLGKLVSRADIVEAACRGWRSEGKRRLEAGLTIPGWKLIEGRAGKRQWSSEKQAEEIMKAARIKSDVMYSRSLLTYPASEKVFQKGKPKVWKKLMGLMTQAAGAPAMAPASDPKPALAVAVAEQFADVSTVTDISDLI